MAKPTYEELEQRVRELEKEAVERKEDALNDAMCLWQNTFDAISDAVCLLDPKCNMLICNKAMSRFVKKSPQEIIGRKCWEVVHGASKPIEECPVVRMQKTLRRETMLLPRGDRWFNGAVDPLLDDAGNLVGAVHIISDITQLKESEEALQASEERLDAMLNSIGDHMSMMDRDLNIVWANETAKKLFGNDIIGKKCFEVYHKRKKTCEPYPCLTLKAFQDGKVHEHDTQVIDKNGETIYFHCTANVTLRDAEGNPTAVIEISRDVTDVKQAEKALRESEEKYRLLIENIPSVAWITSEHGNTTFISPNVEKIYGYTQKEICESADPLWFSRIHPDDVAMVKESFAMMFSKKQNFDVQYRIQRKDDEWIWVHDMAMMAFEKDDVRYAYGVFSDITKQRQLEYELQRAQKLESIGILAGGIAHDFNNLLMGIQGHASLALMNTDLDHPHFAHLKGIQEMVQRGTSLTRQLLGFARRGKYELKTIDLNELIDDSSEMFVRTKKEIRVHRKYEQEVCAVEVDRGQIDQVLLNLYVNAWQAMPRGGTLYISTSNVVIDKASARALGVKPGNFVLLRVSDTGKGMDEKTLEHIFDPFFTTKQLGQGTGLGLASSYGIVKAHGGHIEVESEEGLWTTFSIYLPASEKKVEKAVTTVAGFMKGSETVLLVDDETVLLEIGRELLETLGYRVFTATNGRQAIEFYRDNQDKVDIILLDMIMPDMGGAEVYDRVKEINPDIKVLLSSGYSVDGQATEILKQGCNGFIQKPFTIENLSIKIREILDKK